MEVKQQTIQDEIVEFLLSSPTLEQIASFKASEQVQERVRYLLDANRNGTLTAEEHAEMDEIEHLDDFIFTLKIRATEK